MLWDSAWMYLKRRRCTVCTEGVEEWSGSAAPCFYNIGRGCVAADVVQRLTAQRHPSSRTIVSIVNVKDGHVPRFHISVSLSNDRSKTLRKWKTTHTAKAYHQHVTGTSFLPIDQGGAVCGEGLTFSLVQRSWGGNVASSRRTQLSTSDSESV